MFVCQEPEPPFYDGKKKKKKPLCFSCIEISFTFQLSPMAQGAVMSPLDGLKVYSSIHLEMLDFLE